MGNMIRAQSAMEYLMTYGWAILIIAVVMVALFSLGIIGGNGNLPTQCTAASGYTCQTPVLHSGALTLVVGQATGTNWVTANIVFVPQGISAPTSAGNWCNGLGGTAGIPQNSISGGITCASGGVPAGGALASGATESLTYTFSGTQTPIGGSAAGTIWASYQTSTTWYASQLATITLKAV